VVTAVHRNGKVEAVDILSEAGAPLRLHNPWGEHAISVRRNSAPAESARGEILILPTRAGERLQLAPR
jgi:hypothetical protein